MAKTASKMPLAVRPLGRFRKVAVSYTRRDGTTVFKQWPRKRPELPKPVVVAWREAFEDTRSAIKAMTPCTTFFAENITPRSGFTMYDWLSYQYNGRGIKHRPKGQKPNRPPVMFRGNPDKNYPSKLRNYGTKWEGQVRVLTPTAKVSNPNAITGTFGAFTQMPATVESWDTNAFWRVTPTPGRLTIRAAGLYLVTFKTHCYRNGATEMFTRLMLNGTTELIGAHDIGNSFFSGTPQAEVLYYFNPLDYITLEFACNPTGAFYFLDDFSIVAITPETIF